MFCVHGKKKTIIVTSSVILSHHAVIRLARGSEIEEKAEFFSISARSFMEFSEILSIGECWLENFSRLKNVERKGAEFFRVPQIIPHFATPAAGKYL